MKSDSILQNRKFNKTHSIRIRPSLKDNFLAIRPVSRKKPLGKFSTSDFDEQVLEQNDNPILESYSIADPLELNDNTMYNRLSEMRPALNSKILNTVFESTAKVNVKEHLQQGTAPSVLQIADNIAQRTINDYVAEKLKGMIKKRKIQITDEGVKKENIITVYNEFMQNFSLEHFCKFFKCLNTVKAVSIDKNYIIESVYFYFKKNKSAFVEQEPQYFSQLKLKVQLESSCKYSIKSLEQQRGFYQSRLTKIKEYVTKHRLNDSQMLVVSKQIKKLQSQFSNCTAKFTHQHQKVKRLGKDIKDTKERLKAKINGILNSGVYFESGYGNIYTQIVEAQLQVENHILQSLLDQQQLAFLKIRSSLEKKAKDLIERLNQKEGRGSVDKYQAARIQEEVKRIRNQLIILEQGMVERISKLPNRQKHVFSLFGTGPNGRRILNRLSDSDSKGKSNL